ncbi:CAP-Gly domain-containing linker protein 3 [Camarhynchus parvulus]|uniref:CAP-Gly domain-containing linker protein 3 n=1 Tax=Geospiza parvula TaxID=87175 RepID=UPI001237F074|nr:CAP-Gly domain-containing linker protein 3 [Camarhynchus parvulus]
MRTAPGPSRGTRRPRHDQGARGDPPAGGAPPPDPPSPPSPLVERRKKPMVHPAAPAPLPKDYAFTFFDPNDAACREILLDPRTSVPQLFAILRQWVPQVQHSVDVIGNEVRDGGTATVDDRDGLTHMTLLHYACKAGAHGVGDPAAAVRLSQRLLALGGDAGPLRSRWTHMNAHTARWPELIQHPLRARPEGDPKMNPNDPTASPHYPQNPPAPGGHAPGPKQQRHPKTPAPCSGPAAPRVLHSTCSDFSHGTALHIAASNLCLGAVRCLLEHGADPALRNSKGQVAAEVVPDPTDMALDRAEAAEAARELRRLLLDAVPLSCSLPRVTLPNYDNLPGTLMLLCLGLQLGDRVRLDSGKVGTLRFCGTTAFASGQWAGVELDEPEGKNDGSVGGVRYFICPPKTGVFASVSKISKAEEQPPLPSPPPRTPPPTNPDPHKPPQKNTGRYWFGVELDSAGGKHDGSVFGVRYFTCPPKHGVFAPPSRVQRVGGPKEEPGDGTNEKKAQPVTVSQPKRFPAVRTPKDITSESSFSRLLFCCWFPWMLRAEMQS